MSERSQLQGTERELERRLIVARALALEHGYHDEEDQLHWDRKAQAVLRELDYLEPEEAERLFEAPASYVIQVCATCGLHAVYPFSCGHRSETEPWTAPIVVKPSKATRRAVEESMRLSAQGPEQ